MRSSTFRYGEKLILQTCHNESNNINSNSNNHHHNNQLKLQIPCCNHIDKDTQSSSKSRSTCDHVGCGNATSTRTCLDHSQSSYSAPSSSEPSTFVGTPKLLTRSKCPPSNTFHHPQCMKLLVNHGTDTDTNFYASTDIVIGNGNNHDASSGLRGVCGTSLLLRQVSNTPQMIVPPRKVELIAGELVPPGDLYGEGRFGQVRRRRTERHA
jgi:hypothetical protein